VLVHCSLDGKGETHDPMFETLIVLFCGEWRCLMFRSSADQELTLFTVCLV